MNALALLCTLHADGPATLRLLRRAGIDGLAEFESRGQRSLCELLQVEPRTVRRLLREARLLRERLGLDFEDEEEAPADFGTGRDAPSVSSTSGSNGRAPANRRDALHPMHGRGEFERLADEHEPERAASAGSPLSSGPSTASSESVAGGILPGRRASAAGGREDAGLSGSAAAEGGAPATGSSESPSIDGERAGASRESSATESGQVPGAGGVSASDRPAQPGRSFGLGLPLESGETLEPGEVAGRGPAVGRDRAAGDGVRERGPALEPHRDLEREATPGRGAEGARDGRVSSADAVHDSASTESPGTEREFVVQPVARASGLTPGALDGLTADLVRELAAEGIRTPAQLAAHDGVALAVSLGRPFAELRRLQYLAARWTDPEPRASAPSESPDAGGPFA